MILASKDRISQKMREIQIKNEASMQIQSLNANLGGAISGSPTSNVASANESTSTPLPKVVFEAILAKLAKPNQEFAETLRSPAQATGEFGKVYAAEPVGELENSTDPNLIESLSLQSVASIDLSPASTNLTNALMLSLSTQFGNQFENPQSDSNSDAVKPQILPAAGSGLQVGSVATVSVSHSALNPLGISNSQVRPRSNRQESSSAPNIATFSVESFESRDSAPSISGGFSESTETKSVASTTPFGLAPGEKSDNGKLLIPNSSILGDQEVVREAGQNNIETRDSFVNPPRSAAPAQSQNLVVQGSPNQPQVSNDTDPSINVSETQSHQGSLNRPSLAPPSAPSSSPAASSLEHPTTAAHAESNSTIQPGAFSSSESPVLASEVASSLPNRFRRSGRAETQSTESVDLPSDLPTTSIDSIETSDRSFDSTDGKANLLFPEELNVTDIQISAENRTSDGSIDSTFSVVNPSSADDNLEHQFSPTTSATEPGQDRFHPIEINSPVEIKQTSETVTRDFRLPQVGEKTISEVVSQIVAQRNIESNRSNEVTRIRIEIDPPELGEISIEISRSPHQTVATVVVANEHAQQQLSGNIQQLQSSLESMGVEFKQVDIQQQFSEQTPFNTAQRDSNSHHETPDQSQRDSSNQSGRNPDNSKDGSGENNTNEVSIRSVHVVDVLV